MEYSTTDHNNYTGGGIRGVHKKKEKQSNLKAKKSKKPKIKHLRSLTEAAAGLQVNYFYAKDKM